MEITKDTLIGDLVDNHPETTDALFEIGMFCVGCPHSRTESLEEAALVHGADLEALLKRINELKKDS